MLGGWLRNKILKWANDSQARELESFILSLKGQSRHELGMLLALASIMRMALREDGTLPDEALGKGEPLARDAEALIPLKLSRLIKDFQALGQLQSAAGTMVWLHSMRAIVTPELRLLGRKMWEELQRGFDSSEDQLAALQDMLPPGKVPYFCFLMLKEIPEPLSPENY